MPRPPNEDGVHCSDCQQRVSIRTEVITRGKEKVVDKEYNCPLCGKWASWSE
ncbi:MAG: hypothetical protein KGJ23_07680 [Euryarchaeota archaeon]|nr:hypothetical protein [Euryarchaeota archaeon]MDE1836479.1 hypothetical protein [Euryarchaeota archaeon]MDE1880256.1 hypothetical protein [Euryarchaeota archaeon]MDE2044685.1 hypothetical protein [Thermoplasmata archaeon]